MKKLRTLQLSMVILAIGALKSNAQLAPLGAMYFHNQYLNNPAVAGQKDGLTVDLGIRQQWSSLPGSPTTQVFTAGYALTSKTGLGLSFYNEEAGLIKQTRVMGTYSYHLPLDGLHKKLSFGLSLGYMDELIDYSSIDGDAADQAVVNFNQREKYIDGDFGLMYTSERLEVQFSAPNLKSLFMQDESKGQIADAARYYAAVSYKFRLPEKMDMAIEPKLAFRSVKNFKNLIDAGANLSLAGGRANVMGVYHTSKNSTLGIGGRITESLLLMGVYTSGSAPLRSDVNGNFEINLKLEL